MILDRFSIKSNLKIVKKGEAVENLIILDRFSIKSNLKIVKKGPPQAKLRRKIGCCAIRVPHKRPSLIMAQRDQILFRKKSNLSRDQILLSILSPKPNLNL